MSADGGRCCHTDGRAVAAGAVAQPGRGIMQRAIRAVILDLDGTLYLQRPVRLRMLRRLLAYCVGHPAAGYLTLRMIIAYRQAQELLRRPCFGPPAYRDIAEAQMRLACGLARVEPEAMRSCVARWMEREPLDLLKRHLRPGARESLVRAKERGLRLAVLSDYPARDKLLAMGLTEFFDVVVTASDADVQRFKPHPKGVQVALARLGVEPEEAVYIGDREEVDGAAAAAAGVACVILTRHQEISTLLNCLLPPRLHLGRLAAAIAAVVRGGGL